MRWDNEVNASFRLLDDEPKTLITEGEKIKLIGAEKEVHFYDIVPCKEHPEGAYEFEVILKEKPLTNKIEFTLETKGLDFFYQPEITQEEKDKGTVRPDNIVGSYAVYASENKINYIGGKKYKVGKIGHIFRPKIIDAKGAEVWGELNIDIEKGLLTVIIPQDFLDKAVYPIRHVAGLTFGYTSAGGTGYSLAYENTMGGTQDSTRRGSVYQAGESGILDSISFFCLQENGSGTINANTSVFVNEKDSGGANIHGQIAVAEASVGYENNVVNERLINLSSEEIDSAVDYILNIVTDADPLIYSFSGFSVRGDSTGAVSYLEVAAGSGSASYDALRGESPWTTVGTGTIKHSIYATYSLAVVVQDIIQPGIIPFPR